MVRAQDRTFETRNEAAHQVEVSEGQCGYLHKAFQCEERAFKPNVDGRWNILLCRSCFYALARGWQDENVRAGLCRCGADTLPDLSRCLECNIRERRRAKAAYNKRKAAAQVEAEEQRRKDELLAALAAREEMLDNVTDEQWAEAFSTVSPGLGQNTRLAEHLGLPNIAATGVRWSPWHNYASTGTTFISGYLRRKTSERIRTIRDKCWELPPPPPPPPPPPKCNRTASAATTKLGS